MDAGARRSMLRSARPPEPLQCTIAWTNDAKKLLFNFLKAFKKLDFSKSSIFL